MNCENHIIIKSLKFFGNKPGNFCLAQKSKHPMLFEKNCCEGCKLYKSTNKNIKEFSEEQANNKFGIWEFLGPNDEWKK